MHFKSLVVITFILHIYIYTYCKATNLYRLFTILFYWSYSNFHGLFEKIVYLLLKLAAVSHTLSMSQILRGALKQYANITVTTNSKMLAAKYFIKRQLVYVMKSLKHLRKKFELLEQNVKIIVIISKIKLPEKIINLLRK